MTPVTDPTLIAQLEGSPGLKPVTDPGLISQLESGNAQPAQSNPSLLPRLGADLLAGRAQDGHGLLNAPHNLVSYFNPKLGAMIPTQQDYNFGQMLGVNNPNMFDKLIQGASQYAPYMALPGGALAQGLAFGATHSQNPITGALTGGLLGKASELAPAVITGAGNLIGKAANAIRPQKFAEQLLDSLGGGNSLEGNAKSLAQDVQNAYTNRVNQGQALYKPVFDTAGNKSIYEGANPASSAYQTLDNDVFNSYDRNLNKLHQQFTESPTLQNAHNLQSQLGSSIRKLQSSDAKGNLSVADRSTLQGYQDAQTAVKNDINTFLTSQNPALANQYNAASANWAQNVTPYLENSKLAQIAKGDITNPKNITSLFSKPEPEVQQIIDDIGDSARNKILYSELGKTQANLTPEKLSAAFNQLDNKGLGSYVTPTLQQQFDQLLGRTTARNNARIAAGAVLGGHLGGPWGAGAGAVAAPVIGKLGRAIPSLNIPLSNALLNAGRATYNPLVGSGIANTINRSP